MAHGSGILALLSIEFLARRAASVADLLAADKFVACTTAVESCLGGAFESLAGKTATDPVAVSRVGELGPLLRVAAHVVGECAVGIAEHDELHLLVDYGGCVEVGDLNVTLTLLVDLTQASGEGEPQDEDAQAKTSVPHLCVDVPCVLEVMMTMRKQRSEIE